MNDAWGYDENDGTDLGNINELNGPKALRDAYEKQQKMLQEIQSQLQQEREDRKKEKLSTVFESLGVPGAANVYQGEPDPEKAKAWVESMRNVFSGQAQGIAPAVTDTPAAPALDAGQQEQLQRMTEAGQQGQPIGGFEAAQAAVNDATDLASLIAGFQNSMRNQG